MKNTSRRVLKKYSAPLGAQTSDPIPDSHQQKWNHHQDQYWGQIAGRHNEPLIAGFISKTHSLSPWDAEYFQLLSKPCILEIKINNCKLVFLLHCRNSAGIWSQITGMPKLYYVKLGRFLSTISLLILENTHASTHNSYSMLFLKPKKLVKSFCNAERRQLPHKIPFKSPSTTLLRQSYSFQTYNKCLFKNTSKCISITQPEHSPPRS